MQDPLFFIAVIPNIEIQEEVTNFKQYADKHFDSRHALKSPPHITLQPPFRWSLKKLKSLKDNLSHNAKNKKPFLLNLKNWDHFRDRVIFIDVLENEDLFIFQKTLSNSLHYELGIPQDRRPYHPHMTVAFKDLKPNQFPNAWKHFSKINYERIFMVDQISLLRHHNKKWEIFENYKM